MSYGKTILNEEDVMDGVASMITELEIEATFPRRHETYHRPSPYCIRRQIYDSWRN